MANRSDKPGDPQAAAIESRRAGAAPPADSVTPAGDGRLDGESTEAEGAPLDLPDMGTFSAESARPTPLDDIAETERESLPKD